MVLVIPARVVAIVKTIKQDAQVCVVTRVEDNIDVVLQGIIYMFVVPHSL